MSAGRLPLRSMPDPTNQPDQRPDPEAPDSASPVDLEALRRRIGTAALDFWKQTMPDVVSPVCTVSVCVIPAPFQMSLSKISTDLVAPGKTGTWLLLREN